MTRSSEALHDSDRSSASLRAALEELADMQVDATTSRTIAMAVGMLIERFKIAPEEALDLIFAVSRQKLVGVCVLASELTVGGESEALWSSPASDVASAR